MDAVELGKWLFSWDAFLENPEQMSSDLEAIFQASANFCQTVQKSVFSSSKDRSTSKILQDLLEQGAALKTSQEARFWISDIGNNLFFPGLFPGKCGSLKAYKKAFTDGRAQIFQILKDRLPYELKEEVQNLFDTASVDTFPKDLLLYAEGVCGTCEECPGDVLRKSAVQIALFPKIFDLVQQSYLTVDPTNLGREVLFECLQELSNLQICMQELNFKDLKKSNFFVDRKLIAKIVKDLTPLADFKRCNERYTEHLLAWITANQSVCPSHLSKSLFYPQGWLPFSVGMRVQNTPGEEGLHLIFFSEEGLKEENAYVKEYGGFELFFPKTVSADHPIIAQDVLVVCAQKEKSDEILPLVLKPFGLEPSISVFRREPLIFSRGPYRARPDGGSIREKLQVCENLFSELLFFRAQGWSYANPESWNVKTKRDLQGNLGWFLDPFQCFWQGGEKQKQDPLLALNRITRTLFSCEWQDLNRSQDQWESRLQKQLNRDHYRQVSLLKEKHGGFQGGFVLDLLTYVRGIPSYEQDQSVFLRRFAGKVAIFPVFYDLFEKNMLGERIFFEKIERALAQSKKILCEMEGVLSNASHISITQAKSIVDAMLGDRESPEKKENYSLTLQTRLMNCFAGALWKDRPCQRLSKKNTGLPFSLWATEEKDVLRLTAWDSSFQKEGGHKKVKGAHTFLVPKEGAVDPLSFSTVLYRLKKDKRDYSKGLQAHKMIFERIPQAVDHFMPYPVFFPKYEGARKDKQESENYWYNGTLCEAAINLYLPLDVQETQHTPILISDLLKSFQKTLQGIKLLSEYGIAHGDLTSDNVAIKVENGALISHLYDFDYAGEVNTFGIASKGLHVDGVGRKFNFLSPQTDRYSFVYLMQHFFLFPDEKNMLRKSNSCELLKIHAPRIKHKYLEQIILEQAQAAPAEKKELLLKARQDGYKAMQKALWKFTADETMGERAGIRRLIISLSFLEELFDLCKKMTDADASSLKYMQSHLKSAEPSVDLLRLALDQANFPTFEEIQSVLDVCEQKANDLERHLETCV